MRQVLGGFGLLAGATYPFRVLAVFRRTPHLWRYVAIPILVNLVVGILLYAGLLFFGWETVESLILRLSNWLDSLIINLPTWLSFLKFTIVGLGFLLHFLLVVVLLLLTGFVFVQFGVLIGAPWYGQLSEQLEKLRFGELQIIEVNIVQEISRVLLFEVKKLVLAVGVGIGLLLVSLMPGIGTIIASVGGISLAALIVCLDFLDAPLERRRLSFREKLSLVFKSLPGSASFSLVCLGLVSIPLLNLLTIPLCVASGTLFFCDRISPKLALPPSPINSSHS
ncbi:Sulfate transporter, CysZ-type [uncultured Coleofasciculus sp.]|uniref:Sulfate transporter, CysZ-type n=1 Tax=uncultured Coleofasciculus sp. TaxID=1267456 RepID=A0A6J4K2N6_9CYAN|nr:Sulfate transporter, CysZ-type [uncultured Coleofasciculus sp.]